MMIKRPTGEIFVDEWIRDVIENPRVQEFFRRRRAHILDKESDNEAFKSKLICAGCGHPRFNVELDLICLILICEKCKKRHCLQLDGGCGELKSISRDNSGGKEGT